MKRVLSFALACCLFFLSQASVYAAHGYRDEGTYSHSKTRFGFITEDTVIVYGKEADDDPTYTEVWPGSHVYIPIGVLGASGSTPSIASDKQIKDNTVAVSHRAVTGGQYIEDISIVNGKKAKVDGLASGNYVRVMINKDYDSLKYSSINLKLVLSVNTVSYPETQVELVMHLVNREEDIDDDTVYPVHSPTRFRTLNYSGKATFDFGDKIRYTARVARKSRYYLNLNREENTAIAAMYPDAYMEFYNFVGDSDTFESKGSLEIPINRSKFTPKRENKAQVYVYEIQDDTLKAMDTKNMSYDSKNNLLTIQTQTLKNYVLANQALMQAVETTEDNIIYSGYASPLDDQDKDSGTATPDSATQTGAATSAGQCSSTPSGYNPLANDNVNTGLTINATNSRADNPSTADVSTKGIIALMILAAVAIIAIWKSGWLKKDLYK